MTSPHSLWRQGLFASAGIPQPGQAAIFAESINDGRRASPIDRKQISGELAVALIALTPHLPAQMIAVALFLDIDGALIVRAIGILALDLVRAFGQADLT